MLIRAECDINACDKNKWTPLMNACYWANEDAVLVLLKSGADSNLRNIVRKNLWNYRNYDIINWFINKIQDGRTALHEVCRSPATQKEDVLARIAKRLIQSGSDVNLASSSQVKSNFNKICRHIL